MKLAPKMIVIVEKYKVECVILLAVYLEGACNIYD